MEISIKHEEALTIELTGRLDTVTSTELADAVAKETVTEPLIVIDFKALEYISSAGLRVLLSAQQKMNKQGSMKVINVSDGVKEIFEITGFSKILTVN